MDEISNEGKLKVTFKKHFKFLISLKFFIIF